MPVQIAIVHEPFERAAERSPAVAAAELLIDWRTDRANVAADVTCIHGLARSALPDPALDLLDIAIALYVADIAVRRGEREAWPRDIELAVPVRAPDLWNAARADLCRLVYVLTRDSIGFTFYPAPQLPAEEHTAPAMPADFEPDCVAMLSGGLDSLAGAVLLQRTGRRPIYSMHRSGNPAVRAAQDAALQSIERHWPGQSATCACTVTCAPGGADALDFPPAEQRESSRRARSFLFMALAALTAEAAGVDEVLMCENGVLTAGLPLSPARAGSMSTHSTHPAALALFNEIAERMGLRARVSNPFIYETKADLIRDILAPHLSPQEIQSTVSCWAVGRAQRQCGGCMPCLLRRIGTAWAALPEEAYMIDILGEPERYVGTDAYGNLVDLLAHARQIAEHSDVEILTAQPELLALQSAGLSIPEVIAMLRRHADQTLSVVADHYPATARLVS